ncbi:DUF418 domain-containing protein [Nocardiopsis composta]|uniref:Putative membrane protein YeiB n=1 Tax=Nocardiopsis composta TaxID=157465 RepID=A0A7W8QJJ2_9ACTN|nr:DUF418 domain-containing protein [Nocardiopsis composta]MBB5430920.1 putative membrane protein YeiB [Nocardiopsis composta]
MTTDRTGPPPPKPAPGPLARSTPVSERVLAPDLARGMMLLLIALAHVPWFLYEAPMGEVLLHPVGGNLADRAAQALTLIVVDARTHTMFGFLFAYGIGQMYARQTARGTGPKEARRLLRRRHLWMLVLGAVHAVLLWQGDIIGVYGLIGLVMVPLFLGRGDRALKIWVAVLLALGALIALVTAVSAVAAPVGAAVGAGDIQRLSIAEAGYPSSAAIRFPTWLLTLVSGLFTLALPTAFLIGLLAARHRILEEPSRHLPLLRRIAVPGIATGWLTGAALALQHVGAVDLAPEAVLSGLHFYTGIFAGVGYAALFGLIAHRITARGARELPPVRALVALGRRSLSGYLAQSLVFGPFLAAWGLGLGAYLSSWSAALVALGTWLLTVAAASLMDRAGVRGPAETLLRRLTYRPAGRPASRAPE